MKRQTPTIEDHAKQGRDLFDAHNATMRVVCATSRAYGPNSDVCRAAIQAQKALLNLRSLLDDRICSENPSEPARVVCGAYFPGAAEDRAA